MDGIQGDTEPLITAQYNAGNNPRVSTFYDELENSRDYPDKEASMDLSSMNAPAEENTASTSSELVYL